MRVGVFGGTFDPIHWGHLVLAEEARVVAGLDRVLFVPSASPPHKQGSDLTPWVHRSEMVRLAIDGHAAFELSDIESDATRPHYTLETLECLAAQRQNDELSFLIGSDSLLDMPGWRNPDAIAARWPLVVLPRPGFDPALADRRFTARMTLVEGVSVAVSSTLVRRRLAEGGSVQFLLPPTVVDYARHHHLYGNPR